MFYRTKMDTLINLNKLNSIHTVKKDEDGLYGRVIGIFPDNTPVNLFPNKSDSWADMGICMQEMDRIMMMRIDEIKEEPKETEYV